MSAGLIVGDLDNCARFGSQLDSENVREEWFEHARVKDVADVLAVRQALIEPVKTVQRQFLLRAERPIRAQVFNFSRKHAQSPRPLPTSSGIPSTASKTPAQEPGSPGKQQPSQQLDQTLAPQALPCAS
jgi:hypothetical protein